MLLWFFIVTLCAGCYSEGLVEFLKWKQIEYEQPNSAWKAHHHHHHLHKRTFSRRKTGSPDFAFPDSLKKNVHANNFDYIPYNNVPMGVNHHKGRLFITMPRRRPGIPATLNYVDISRMTTAGESPKLKGYPNYAMNHLHHGNSGDSQRIISVYRTRTDSCNRLWFIDTGMLEYPDNRTQVQQPSIWVINLMNDLIVKRFEIPANIVNDGRGLASITVDVDNDRCDEAFAYIPDLYHNALYVYSFKENRIWTFHHNYFSFDPLWGDLTIAGQSFQWDDGIFSITLGKKNPDGFRTAYFHPMVSTSEFAVSTKVLRNETSAARSYHGNDFQHLGFRGPWKQSTMHDFDPKTGTIFYAEIAKYGVGCWNTNKPFSAKNHGVIQQDEAKMIYPSDLTVDQDGIIWVMTNSMPLFIYSHLDPNVYNFRVWKKDSHEAIENTVCKI